MGFAIIWIILFHFKAFESIPVIGTFFSLGELGVDIFLFLSAYGLCKSLEQSESTKVFYIKRIVRILPVWLFFLLAFHIKNVYTAEPHPTNFAQSLCYYSGIGWWIRAFISSNPHNYWYEWYIPTLLLFYAFFPLMYYRKNKTQVEHIFLWIIMGSLLIVLPVFLQHFGINNVVTQACSQLHWSYQRIPIFLLGIIVHKMLYNKKLLLGGGIYLCIK